MALTRAMLKGMGLTEEQVSAIIEEHTNVTASLKDERDSFKESAEKLPKVEKELADLKQTIDAGDSDEWKKKYEKEHSDFEAYKKDVSDKETTSKVKEAYKKLLIENNVGEKHIDAILRVTEFKDMKLDKDGNLVNADELADSIKSEWSGFIKSTETKGAEVDNPPNGDGKKMTKEDIMKIKDTSERQKAIADNHELFGIQ